MEMVVDKKEQIKSFPCPLLFSLFRISFTPDCVRIRTGQAQAGIYLSLLQLAMVFITNDYLLMTNTPHIYLLPLEGED
jgi:hypothetical protein